ncbi:hypothetical protein MTBUT4_390007 [Magnetospirillum sp. UT-4]|nr:hypothetical protein MTBUT4_390007 [Magnetospirillum sp. UT-4]
MRPERHIAPAWTPAFAGVTDQRVASRVFPHPAKSIN